MKGAGMALVARPRTYRGVRRVMQGGTEAELVAGYWAAGFC